MKDITIEISYTFEGYELAIIFLSSMRLISTISTSMPKDIGISY